MKDDQSSGVDHPTSTPVEAGIGALVENASRLGLTWDLRPATVLATDSSTGRISLQADGDDAPVSGESMVGRVPSGTRVFVIILPPGGIFIVGFVGVLNRAGDSIGSAYWTGGTTAGSTGAEAALGSWTSSAPFVLGGHRVARLTLAIGYLTNSAAVSSQIILVRKVVGSTSAAALLTAQQAIPAGVSGTVLSLVGVSYIKNTTGGPITFNPGVSNIRSSGSGTNSIFGDTNITMSLVGNDIGDVASPELAGIIGLAVTI